MIGINSQIQTGGSGDGNVGIGFAVPINTAREVVQQIEEHGEVKHAYLGISGGSITPDLAKALKLPEEEGVLVNEVVKGGPADEAGIKGGDTSATIEGASFRLGGDVITEVERQEDHRHGRRDQRGQCRVAGRQDGTDGRSGREAADDHGDAWGAAGFG